MTGVQTCAFRSPGGKALPNNDETASLVSGTTRRFLVDANYDAILDYNCAHSYALSVGLLADAIESKTWKAAPSKKGAPPRTTRKTPRTKT